jgi:hypothetical protein
MESRNAGVPSEHKDELLHWRAYKQKKILYMYIRKTILWHYQVFSPLETNWTKRVDDIKQDSYRKI